MRALWQHIEFNYREGGLRQVLYKVFWRFQQWLWSESVWLVYRLEVAGYQGQPRLPLVRSPLELPALVQLRYFKAVAFPEGIQARLNSGAVCHGFFLDQELLNIGWTTNGCLELEGGLSIPGENCIGVFDCFTLPAHRSKGVYTDTLISFARFIRDQGAAAALIAVDPGNLPSIRGIERAGFQPLFRLRRLRRFGRESMERSVFALRLA